MANTTTSTKKKPSSPDDDGDAIVELLPPADQGFSGTAKFYAVGQAVLIEELLKRGYAVVDQK